jgi:hypothetical protein
MHADPRHWLIGLAILVPLAASPTQAAGELHLGYYAGSQMFYPYDPVYCEHDDKGPCYGVHIYVPKSAPLPAHRKWCRWADIAAQMSHPGIDSNWYQRKPRIVAAERQKYLGERVCYLEDKGEPKKLEELERDDP